MTVALNHRISGAGEPLVLLHGLFGSLDNLGGIARRLEDQWQIHGLDLRNHGGSPHTETMDYPAMAADVIAYLDSQGVQQANILGHSMGGKVAMQLALSYPDRVRSVIVADIAPVTYPPRHDAVLGEVFRWRLNLPVIDACYQNLAAAPDGQAPYQGPVLFIKGADSAYIQEKHRGAIKNLFPNAELKVIEGTGHWLHAEKADTFAALCRRFLSGIAQA